MPPPLGGGGVYLFCLGTHRDTRSNHSGPPGSSANFPLYPMRSANLLFKSSLGMGMGMHVTARSLLPLESGRWLKNSGSKFELLVNIFSFSSQHNLSFCSKCNLFPAYICATDLSDDVLPGSRSHLPVSDPGILGGTTCLTLLV